MSQASKDTTMLIRTNNQTERHWLDMPKPYRVEWDTGYVDLQGNPYRTSNQYGLISVARAVATRQRGTIYHQENIREEYSPQLGTRWTSTEVEVR